MQEILYPVGRLVGGSLYRANPVLENDGKTPKRNTDGTPKTSFSFGVAFPKTAGQHWAATDWGQKVWAEGHAAYPNGEGQAPAFAWKVTDGDSTIPNKRGNKPAENDGYPGNWVVWFSGSYAPKLCDAKGSPESQVAYMDGAERIKPGHYVQVFGTCKGNNPSPSPGVYQNYVMVAHSGFGAEIATGTSVDASKVGFGGALPAGASAVPLGAVALPGQSGAPAIPAGAPVAPAAPMAAPAVSSIVPNAAFLNAPPVAAAMPAPAAAARQMTAKATGFTRDQMVAGGWTDAALIEQGYMTA
jgi:hypothetical protein